MTFLTFLLIVALFVLIPNARASDTNGVYLIGTAAADITGAAAGTVLNGYVNPLTLAAGVHIRTNARAFVVQSETDQTLICFVAVDMGMLDHAIKLEVLNKLKQKHGTKFTADNVMISASHTHSSPSGFMQYYAYLIIESYGFNPLTFWAIVDGIVEAIDKAESNMVQGKIYRTKGALRHNSNRSGGQYLENPEWERNLYADNTDKDMTLLRMETLTGEPLGSVNWWAAHPIQFNGFDNPLISADMVGVAALMFDERMNNGARPREGRFVSAFASSNLGDVSGSRGGNVRVNMTEALYNVNFMGKILSDKAHELYHDAGRIPITGRIQHIHQYVNMTNYPVQVYNNETGQMETKHVCKGALGYNFVGIDPAMQEFFDWLRDLIFTPPTKELIDCQAPKLVALHAGELTEPWAWAPDTVDLQLLRLGDFYLVGVPGEFTTMAGRRLRNAVSDAIPGDEKEVVIAGLANNYVNYIATTEEYAIEDYEGSATIFGPYELNGYIDVYEKLMAKMLAGDSVDEGPIPPNFINLVRPKIQERVDQPMGNREFGDVIDQPKETYTRGETMLVSFAAAAPRHNPMRSGTYFLVEKLITGSNDQWQLVKTDSDRDTTFYWNMLANRGQCRWFIPEDAELGTYRVRHFGYVLRAAGERPGTYSGMSNSFKIVVSN